MVVRVISILLFAFLVGVIALFVTRSQSHFLREMKDVATSKVDYLMLCDLRPQQKDGQCRTIGSDLEPQLVEATRLLAGAEAKLPPGKLQIADEKILRIGRGTGASGHYVGCYRVVQYVGVNDIYINDVETDSACTRVETYRPGYVAIGKHWLDLFTTAKR